MKTTILDLGEIFRRNLERLMRESRLSQAELAKRIAIPPQSIFKYLKGRRSPGLDVLGRIATGLGVTPHELLAPEGDSRGALLSRDKLYEIFSRAITEATSRPPPFTGLSKATPAELQESVRQFGGWDALYEHLREDRELRQAGEDRFSRTRREIYQSLQPENRRKKKSTKSS